MQTKQYTDIALIRRLFYQAKPYKFYILGIFLLELLATPLALITPIPMKIAVDNVIGDQPLHPWLKTFLPEHFTTSQMAVLLFAASLIIIIALIRQLLGLFNSLSRTYTGEKMVLDFRAKLFRHGQRLSFVYHDKKGITDTIYRILWDSATVRYVTIDESLPLITALITLISMIYVIFMLDWQLSLVALSVSPFLVLISYLYRSRLRQESLELKKLESTGLNVIQESLSALRIVKSYGQEDREQERFINRYKEGFRARIKYTFTVGRLGIFLGLTTAVGTTAVFYIGLKHVMQGTLTLGNFLLIMGYLSQLFSPLKMISKKIGSLQGHLASAERVYEFIDQEQDVIEKPNAIALNRAKGTIQYQNVYFSYDGTNEVLKGITFDVQAGMRIGIAGQTGAGKTTLVSLLTRFYDPSIGKITLDGIDLRDYKIADLRDQFSIMLQEPILFSTTIAENISYAKPDASQNEIEMAARSANIHEFIVGLHDGYNTQVGERGMRLSSGERQRISLARAFLKDAPILILDEPTSSVDIETEVGIMQAIERLMADRTTFIIAHRLSTLENCDELLLIQDGQFVVQTKDVHKTIQKVRLFDKNFGGA